MSSKLENLPATTSLASTDILYAVTSPSSSPVDNKITFGNLSTAVGTAIGSSFLTTTTGQYKTVVTIGSSNADFLVGSYSNDFGQAYNAAYASLPSAGSAIFILPGTYSAATAM